MVKVLRKKGEWWRGECALNRKLHDDQFFLTGGKMSYPHEVLVDKRKLKRCY